MFSEQVQRPCTPQVGGLLQTAAKVDERLSEEERESVKTIARQELAALPTEPAVDASEYVEPPAKMRRIYDFDDEVHDEPRTDEMMRYHHFTVSSAFLGILPWWKDNQPQRTGRESPDQKYSTSQSVHGDGKSVTASRNTRLSVRNDPQTRTALPGSSSNHCKVCILFDRIHLHYKS